MCAGILRTEFGRRESRAVNKAVIQLAAEEALTGKTAEPAKPNWWEQLQDLWSAVRRHPRLAYGAALILAIGLAGWFGRTASIEIARTKIPVCTLSDAQDARWAKNSVSPQIGQALLMGTLRLEAGVVELTFGSSAKVAVEGPAQFKLTGNNSMELVDGKIATEVPRRARGFSVKMPTATVVDLGTRFGASINTERASEVDVFQGTVELTAAASAENPRGEWRLTQNMAMIADEHGAVAATALSEAAFPQPNLTVIARPQNCGFDVSARAALGGIPKDFGFWSGPAYSLTGPVDGIQPVSGPGMLQFLNNTSGSTGDSEVWQVVDMHPFKKLLASGLVEANLSAMFNQLAGDTPAGNKFGLTLAAFHGLPVDAPSLWAHRNAVALALADKELIADDNPRIWGKIEVAAKLPADTDFVIVAIRAVAAKDAAGKTIPFAGCFADLVDMKLSTPMRASSIATSR